MEVFLAAIEFWWWWAFAAGLLLIEVLAPGFFFLWFAAAALVMGFVLLLVPGFRWEWQLICFAVLGVAALWGGRAIFKRRPLRVTDQPNLNRRGEGYVGRQLTLAEAISNGYGWAKVDDGRWRVSGPDLPAGSHVRVVAAEGATLKVAPL